MEIKEMAKIYAELIRKGLKTIDDVPEKIKDQVKQVLAQLMEEVKTND